MTRPAVAHPVTRGPMSTCSHRVSLLALLLLLTAGGCGLVRGRGGSSAGAAASLPVTGAEVHSLRLPVDLGPAGEVELGTHPPLAGRLLLAPILAEEGIDSTAHAGEPVQVVVHYGRFYVALDGFHAVWELQPVPGSGEATYRPIPVLDGDGDDGLRGVRLSRYGRPGATCVRIDHDSGPTVFIDRRGRHRASCP